MSPQVESLLNDLLEYMQEREDASCEEGHWSGNEEMHYAQKIREALGDETK